MPKIIPNTSYYNNNTLITNQEIEISGTEIAAIRPAAVTNNQLVTVPGFIDLQIYGSGGRLFSADPTIESLTIMEDDLLKKGTTGFLACLATNTPEVFNACIETVKAHRPSAKKLPGTSFRRAVFKPKTFRSTCSGIRTQGIS